MKKSVDLKLARNLKNMTVRYDRKGNATVSMKTTSGKSRTWKKKARLV